VLAAGFAAAALGEGILRPNLAWRPLIIVLVLVLIVVLAPALLWRRSHPLLTCLIGFGVAGLLSGLQLVTNRADVGLTSMTVIMVLLYALIRWGSGRDIVVGLPFVVVVVALGMVATEADWAELSGGGLFVSLFVALAAVFRYRGDLTARRYREIRTTRWLITSRRSRCKPRPAVSSSPPDPIRRRTSSLRSSPRRHAPWSRCGRWCRCCARSRGTSTPPGRASPT
jgi:uncharacterized MnhB-related membrane protein